MIVSPRGATAPVARNAALPSAERAGFGRVNSSTRHLILADRPLGIVSASEDTRAYFRHRLREDRRQELMEALRQSAPHSEWCDLDRGEDPTRDRDALAWRLERWTLRRAALARRAVAA